MSYEIVRRETKGNAHCRGCSGYLPKGTECIYTYSTANRGQNIFFCLECSKLIGRLAND